MSSLAGITMQWFVRHVDRRKDFPPDRREFRARRHVVRACQLVGPERVVRLVAEHAGWV